MYFFICSSLTNITIPGSVLNIEDDAFQDCYSLTSVSIKSGVKRIDYAAFDNCSSLKNITIPDSVTCIERNVFEGCSKLQSISIPSSVTSISDDIFDGSQAPTIYGEQGSCIQKYAQNNNIPFSTSDMPAPIGVAYSAHVQNIGWQPYVSDGTEAGTDDRCLKVEALQANLIGNVPQDAHLEYEAHVQNIGWQSAMSD